MLPLVALLLSVPVLAAVSPSEADFPDGYWDREVVFGGRAGTTYNLAVVVADPARARGEVEKVLQVPGSKLTSFNDQTAFNYAAGGDYGGMGRVRPAYTLAYQLPEEKAAALAKRLIGVGRLMTYNAQTPYANPQVKELDERIGWIEKELSRSGEALKTMPVSRSLLQSKLKRLKAAADSVKATAGTAAISVQILREEPEAATRKPAPASVP